MKKTIITVVGFLTIVTSASISQAGGAMSQAANESGQAGTHSAKGVAYGAAGAAQVVAGAAAVPLAVSGAAGKVSGQASEELWEAATMEIGEPLPVSDESVTSAPGPDPAPDAVLQGK